MLSIVSNVRNSWEANVFPPRKNTKKKSENPKTGHLEQKNGNRYWQNSGCFR